MNSDTRTERGKFKMRLFVASYFAGFAISLASAVLVMNGLTGGYFTFLSMIVGAAAESVSDPFANAQGVSPWFIELSCQAGSAAVAGLIFPLAAKLAYDDKTRWLGVALTGFLLLLIFGGIGFGRAGL